MWQNGNEDMVLCPYNRFHVVSKLRIQRHLIKCQKNYQNIKLATCFYNYSHKIRPEDMLKHYEICSHKTRVEGSRYYEPGTFNPIDCSGNNNDRSFHFPNTAVKTEKHFYSSRQAFELSKSDFDYEKNFAPSDIPFNVDERNSPEPDFTGSDDDESDDMKPLPLPKTVSKAFTCIKQHPGEHSNIHLSETSPGRGFGRAKHFLNMQSPRPPKTTDPFLPDMNAMDIVSPVKKISNNFSRSPGSSCSASIVSSMFEDTNTLRSQDIVFDDDDNADVAVDGHDNACGLLVKNFDKYVKI